MKNNDLIYDWIDFLSETKSVRRSIIKEQNQVDKVIFKSGDYSRRSSPPRGIVIHTSVTDTPQKTVDVLRQRNLSTNYEVDKEGNIHEYLDPAKYVAYATGENANEHTIGIDVTGDQTLTTKQASSLFNLINNLASRFNFPIKLAPDRQRKNWYQWESEGQKYTLFRHRNFVAKACPGDIISNWMEQTWPVGKEVAPKNIQITGLSNNPEEDSNISGILSSAYDYIKDIGSSAYEKVKNIFSESLDRKIFIINDKSKQKIYTKYQKYFDGLLNMLKKKLKITKPVKIVLEEDEENAKKVLGRTGGYINHENKIHIFITDRHIKDILRSLAHEMIHHHQNLRGEFKQDSKTTHGYAQSNKHLRKMEKEAYLKGNIHFRDWEDNYKYRGEK